MALFGKKEKEEKKDVTKDVAVSTDTKKEEKATKKETKAETKKGDAFVNFNERDLSSVIVRPRITEKAATVGDNNVYTFEVRMDATKYDIRDAVKHLFKVTPVRINTTTKQPRRFMSRMRNRKGVHPGIKKAYVYLKKGDTIDLV